MADTTISSTFLMMKRPDVKRTSTLAPEISTVITEARKIPADRLTSCVGRSHDSILSAWLKVPLAWYHSATVSFFPDEQHEHIARTFNPIQQPGSQRKFCGFCGTNISYWTEQPAREQDFMNITLGSLRTRDLRALEDLDLLPEDMELEESDEVDANEMQPTRDLDETSRPAEQSVMPTAQGGDYLTTSRSGTTGGISWFEDMIQGSQLGYHSKKRKGQGTSADGTTTILWEVTEYYGDDDNSKEASTSGAKRKAGEIETDDTAMKD